MASDDIIDDDPSDDTNEDPLDDVDVRERLEEEADKAVESFDEGIVDLLSWILDTETRARIYVHLRQRPDSTSEEIANGTGLYPSTVREALAELHDDGKVTRKKRDSDGAGNNPYEYAAIAPSELVSDAVEEVQSELNTVFNLDNYLGGESEDSMESDPVTINVEDEEESEDDTNLLTGETEDEPGFSPDETDDEDESGFSTDESDDEDGL